MQPRQGRKKAAQRLTLCRPSGAAEGLSFAGPGPLITDDRPLPEYFLLRRTIGEKSPLVSPQSLADAGFPLP